MAQTVADILVSPVRVFYAPVSTAVPADSVAYGGTWTSWTEVGFTNAPLSWNHEFEEYEAKPQQRIGTVKRVRTSESLTLETTLSEITADNIQLVIGGTVTDTAAGAGQVGKETLDAGGEFKMDERAWGFEGLYIDSTGTKRPVRLFIWKATSTINGAMEFAKESEVGISLQIKALVDTTKSIGADLFKLQKVLANATS